MSEQENIDTQEPTGEENTEVQEVVEDDIALQPSNNADSQADVIQYISAEVRALYEIYSYRHAAAILKNSFPAELAEIERALLSFRITTTEIGLPGGNESEMPKKFSRVLRPSGWVETRIQGDLIVRLDEYKEQIRSDGKIKKSRLSQKPEKVIPNYIRRYKK